MAADAAPVRSDPLPAALPPLVGRPTGEAVGAASPLVGRRAELAELRRLLTDDRARLLTLTGPGGVGKTRLAVRLADESAADYGGCAIVSLAAITAPEQVLTTIVRALGLRLVDDRSPAEHLLRFLQPKRYLLILDNLERVAAAAPALAELVAACPGLTVVATSRVALHVAGERVLPVSPLPLPPSSTAGTAPAITDIAASDAVMLLVQRAAEVRPGFGLTAANATVIADICRRLDGLPLAIELAAARLKLLSPAALLDRLDHRLVVLTAWHGPPPDRFRTMRATIRWSFDLLSPAEQTCFCQLAIFVGGFTAEAAEAVCRTEPLAGAEPPTVLDHLATLVDHNLLRLDERPDGDSWLVMLETIREFGRERLAMSSDEPIVRHRHLDYYLGLAEAAAPRLVGPAQVEWLARLEADHDNFRAALDHAVASGAVAQGLRLASALGELWEIHGHLAEGRRHLAGLLALPDAAPVAVRARALTVAGQLAEAQGDNARAQDLFAAALLLWQELGDQGEPGRALHGLAQQARKRGESAHAIALHEEELQQYRQLGDRDGMSRALNGLGAVAYVQGHYPEAERRFEESLALSRLTGNVRSRSTALNNLGMVAFRRGDHELAAAHHEENVTLTQALGDRQGLAMALGNLAIAVHTLGDVPRSVALASQVLDLFQLLGDQWGTAQALNNLGLAVQAAGDTGRAHALFAESLSLRRLLGDKLGTAVTLGNLGSAVRLAGEPDRAAALFAESLAIYEELAEQSGIATTRVHLGLVAWDQGDAKRAQVLVRQGFEHLHTMDDTAAVADGLEAIAEFAAGREEATAAARLLGAARRLRDGGDVPSFPIDRARYDRLLAQVRQALPASAFAAAWETGRASTPEEAGAAAISVVGTAGEPTRRHAVSSHHGLSPRQIEVLRLVAQGKSDREIAAILSVSPRTVGWHVSNILAKLGLASRSAAAANAVRHGLD